MMEVIKDPTVDFIVATFLSLVTIFLGLGAILVPIWLAFRQPVQLFLSYGETVVPEKVVGTQRVIETIKAGMEVSSAYPVSAGEYYIHTAKIANLGKESIVLPEDTPLTIKFKKGTKVLGIGNFVRSDDSIKVTAKIDAEKALLILPQLDPKESITFRMLLDHNVNYIPDVNARIIIHGKKRIVKANNVRYAREVKILGFLCLGLALVLCAALFSPFHYSVVNQEQEVIIGLFACGICMICISWIARNTPPSQLLVEFSFSSMLKNFIKVMPFFILLGLLAAGIILLFRFKGIQFLFGSYVFILFPLSLWFMFYTIVISFFKKRKKAYNAHLIALLTGILPLALVIYGIVTLVSILLH
jgi:hypothetical protein